ncbi:MAG: MraY family glycosyltransferase [Candidatus Korobacteraceae bacterium]
MLHNLLLLALGGGFSALLTRQLIGWCHRSGRLLYPRTDRWSRRTVAQFGGVPILIAWAGLTLVFASAGEQMQVIVALALCMGAVGLADDIWRLSPSTKFAAQVLAATVAVIAGLSYPLGLHPALNVVFTMLWIVGLTNAFNLIDNMDGLSGGVAIIALVSIVLLMWGDAVIVPAGLIMVGALLGFMVFNVSPARIFMGDTGSLGLGFFLACISILSVQRMNYAASVPVLPVLVFFVPIFDTTLVSFTRRRGGRPIWVGARDHSSHRLVLLGMSERQAVFTLYIFSAIGGLTAYLWKARPHFGGGLLAFFALGAAWLWVYLAQLELPADWLSQPVDHDLPLAIGVKNEKEQR